MARQRLPLAIRALKAWLTPGLLLRCGTARRSNFSDPRE
jgi:hypothetical protein